MTVIPISNRNRSDHLAESVTPHLVTELPGPKARAWIARDAAVTSPSLGRVYPLVPARGDGLVIEDVDGNRFLDFNAGIAVASTGHCHPRVVEAIERQSHALLHYCSSDWYIPSYIELCERLAGCAPAGMGATRTFLANSGTEAVEGALKLARQHTGRPNVIAFHGAFHGRSLGSLSLTASKARYRGGFGAMMPGVFHAPYGESGAIERTILTHLTPPSDVAAIFVEPIQGEGGYLIPPAGWLAELRALCDEHGILLVADEVQSGVGRSGRMWAVDHEHIAPDLVLVGKGIASGLPLAAIVARDEIMQWEAGAHGSTFGGNPVACSAALATLDLVEHGDHERAPLADNARDVGAHLLTGLEHVTDGHTSVHGLRGRGLMIGVDFADHDTAHAVEQECFRRGLLVLTCGVQTVRLAPPLVVTHEQADQAVVILDQAIAAVERTAR